MATNSATHPADFLRFLLAQITEDERVAHAAATDILALRGSAYGVWRASWDQYEGIGVLGYDNDAAGPDAGPDADDDQTPVTRHLTRWSPARVLAECTAKRRIIELHRSGETWCDRCAVADDCPTLRALTLPYTSHPDYRPEWAHLSGTVT